MANPKEAKGTRLSVWLDPLTRQGLEKIAKLEDRKLGYLVRKAIETYIHDYKPTGATKQEAKKFKDFS